MIHGHISALRENPFLTNASIVFIPEKNTGHEAARMWDVVKEYPGTHALYQHKKVNTAKEKTKPHKNPGIVTGKLQLVWKR